MSILRRFRSARTGRYVSHAEAQANQDTTVTETNGSYGELRIRISSALLSDPAFDLETYVAREARRWANDLERRGLNP